jgi:hypothetical protein
MYFAVERKEKKKKASVHLAKRFQRRRFLNIGQSETRIAYGGHIFLLLMDRDKMSNL